MFTGSLYLSDLFMLSDSLKLTELCSSVSKPQDSGFPVFSVLQRTVSFPYNRPNNLASLENRRIRQHRRHIPTLCAYEPCTENTAGLFPHRPKMSFSITVTHFSRNYWMSIGTPLSKISNTWTGHLDTLNEISAYTMFSSSNLKILECDCEKHRQGKWGSTNREWPFIYINHF